MVTISTCASGIPTVVIKSISVLLRGAEFHSCSNSNSLFVDYWQHAGTCQQHVRETSPLSVESNHNAWHFPLCALSLFLSCSPSLAPSEWPSGDNFKLSVDKGFPDSRKDKLSCFFPPSEPHDWHFSFTFAPFPESQFTKRSCEVHTLEAGDSLISGKSNIHTDLWRDKVRAVEVETYKWRERARSPGKEVFLSRPVAIAAISH